MCFLQVICIFMTQDFCIIPFQILFLFLLRFPPLHTHCHQQPQARYEWYSFYDVTSRILLMNNLCLFRGVPGGASGKEPACQCRRCKRHWFDPCVGKIPWRRAWQPTPCLENPLDRGAWQATVHRVARVRHDWSNLARAHTHTCLFHFHVTSEFLMWGL